MQIRRLAIVGLLGAGVSLGAMGSTLAASTPAGIPPVTASRPGLSLVSSGSSHGLAAQASHAGRAGLTPGEGAGKRFCSAQGGYPLGASFDDVYACGPSTGTADDFDTVGFQCVELSERFMWVVYSDFVPNVTDGKDLV